MNVERFHSLVNAMQQMGQPQTGQSPEEKTYVKYKNNTFTVISAKKEKQTAVEDLAEEVATTVDQAIQMHAFQSKDLESVIAGMEALKNRFSNYADSSTSTYKQILRYFGRLDRFDVAIEKIDLAISIARKEALPLEIATLKQEIAKENIETLKNELATVDKQIQSYREIQTDIPKQEQTLSLLRNEQQNIRDKLNPITKEEALLREAKSKAGIFHFTSTPEEKAAKSRLEAAQKQVPNHKELKNKLEELTGSIKKADDRLASDKKKLMNLPATESKRVAISKRIEKHEKLQNSLLAKQAELDALTKVKTFLKKAPSPLFNLPDTANWKQKIAMDHIKARLGVEGEVKHHKAYLRRAIFGFAIGQRKTVDEINKLINDVKLEDLKKMLEAGDPVDNMYCVSYYLETIIPKVRQEGRNPEYLKGLEELQSTLTLSLPLAWRLMNIYNDRVNQRRPEKAASDIALLSQDIRKTLQNMPEGAKLLIPAGTPEHAVLLSARKINGKIDFTLFNTGEGLEQNVKNSGILQQLREGMAALRGKFPITQSYPSVDLQKNGDGVEKMMQGLFKNILSKNAKIDDMYKTLEGTLGKGQAGPPEDIQINGVCSFQCLSAAMKKGFNQQTDQNQFEYDLLSIMSDDWRATTLEYPEEESALEKQLDVRLKIDLSAQLSEIAHQLPAS